MEWVVVPSRPDPPSFTLVVEPLQYGCKCKTSVLCRFQVDGSRSQAQEIFDWDALQMVELPAVEKIMSILQECRKEKDLENTKRIHLHMCGNGLEAHEVLGNYLVPMFVECGSMPIAQRAFHRLTDRNEYCWTSFIQGYLEREEFQLVLNLFRVMQAECVHPSTYTLVALLKACTRLKSVERGKEIHAEIAKEGFETDPFSGNTLVDMYAKCGLPLEAREVFDELPIRDVVSWTALIAGYAEQGLGEEALSCLEEMQLAGMFPNAVTLFCGLKACSSIRALGRGRQIHADIVKAKLERDSFVGNTLVDMYAKCGSLAEARKIFEELPSQDVVSWTALIAGYTELELGEEALACFEQMKLRGVFPDAVTFICSLKACGSIGAIDRGQGIHMEITEEGFERNSLVGSTVVDMYARFGLLAEAQDVLYDLRVRDTVAWNALIGGYAEHGLGEESLVCLEKMQLEGLSLNPVTFVCSLKGCGSIGDIESGREIHDKLVKYGLETNSFVGNSLVDLYAKCGLFSEAQEVFDKLLARDVISWNTIIAGYAEYGLGEEALNCWEQMQSEGMSANGVTFACSLKACGNIGDEVRGQEIHALIAKKGLERDTIVGNTLVDMYAKCGCLADAHKVFEKLTFRDAVLWNTMIVGYTDHGLGEEALNCLEQMQLEGVFLNATTYVCSLRVATSIGVMDKGQELHAEIVEEELESDLLIGNTLVDMYGKYGLLAEAQDVFDNLPGRDIVSWTALISGYAEHKIYDTTLNCLEQMQLERVSPTPLLLARILNACGGIRAIDRGQEIDTQIVKLGFEKEVYISNALVDMYAKCGWLVDAQKVFDKLPNRDAVSWTALIAGYGEHGFGEDALKCLEQMQLAGLTLDAVSFVCSLKASVSIGARDKGQEVHAEIVKEGFETDPYVGNSLVDMYAKGGLLSEAQEVFDELLVQDVVSWTALIAGYAECGLAEEALDCLEQMQVEGVAPNVVSWNAVIFGFSEKEESGKSFLLYSRMQEQGIPPDSATFMSILKACGRRTALEAGRRVHAQIWRVGTLKGSEVIIETGLIDMYGKCGSMVDAQQVFDAGPCRDLVRWNAMVTGYARQEEREIVFRLFERMEEEGIQPDGITFLSILTLCSHAGLVDKGQKYFKAMSKEYGVTPTLKHHSCMVDLLGRAGQLSEAVTMMDKMPIQPDFVAVSTVLGACRKWGNVELGIQAFDLVSSLDEYESAAFTLMSNIYADSHISGDSKEIEVSEELLSMKGAG